MIGIMIPGMEHVVLSVGEMVQCHIRVQEDCILGRHVSSAIPQSVRLGYRNQDGSVGGLIPDFTPTEFWKKSSGDRCGRWCRGCCSPGRSEPGCGDSPGGKGGRLRSASWDYLNPPP